MNGYQKMKNGVYYKAFYEIEADRLSNCGNTCRTYMYCTSLTMLFSEIVNMFEVYQNLWSFVGFKNGLSK